jgi:hypothetical protein
MRALVLLAAIRTFPATAIQTENPNGYIAEVVARRYMTDPDVTFWSYSAASYGCTATMIGPNIAMTAAHCGFNDQWLTFKVNRDMDPAREESETVRCTSLLQTFDDTDLHLLYCPPIGGVNTGDKYGYMDLDLDGPRVGDHVYSLWNNPLKDLDPGNYMLYSEGEVQIVTAGSWTTPTGFDNTAIRTNLWSNYGASGSAQVDAFNHRILIGPTSVGTVEWARRWGLSMRDRTGLGRRGVSLGSSAVPAGLAADNRCARARARGAIRDLLPDEKISCAEDHDDRRLRSRQERARGGHDTAFRRQRRFLGPHLHGAFLRAGRGPRHRIRHLCAAARQGCAGGRLVPGRRHRDHASRTRGPEGRISATSISRGPGAGSRVGPCPGGHGPAAIIAVDFDGPVDATAA